MHDNSMREAVSPQHNLSAAFAKYQHTLEKDFMPMSEAEALSRDLATVIARKNITGDVIVGLANGALVPARIVSDELGLPLEIVFVRRQGSRIKRRLLAVKEFLRIPSRLVTWRPLLPLWIYFQDRTSKLESTGAPFQFEVAGKRVLLVDDCIVTGNSVVHVRDQLLHAGASAVTIAVICWCDLETSSAVEPEVYLHRQIQFYPWSNNSPFYRDFLAWLESRQLALWE
ncbi:MAG TPA: phosphoribosyltransferase [Devosiaceae bacterium]|nr:phosphoribosyltransferase [Devosiaceae bacterium]